MAFYFAIYLLCGCFISFCSGLFGIGGGIIGIPVLLFLLDQQGVPAGNAMHIAIGTMLATVIVTSATALYAHYKRRMVVGSLFIKFVPGAVLGSIIGMLISSKLQGLALEKIFGAFLLLLSLHMLISVKIHTAQRMPPYFILLFAGIILGILSGMLGLGGGVFMIPFFTWCGLSMRHAIATATACIVPIAVIATIGYMMLGHHAASAVEMSSGFIYWPAFIGFSLPSIVFAPLGVKAANTISTPLLKRLFAGVLFVTGLKMLF